MDVAFILGESHLELNGRSRGRSPSDDIERTDIPVSNDEHNQENAPEAYAATLWECFKNSLALYSFFGEPSASYNHFSDSMNSFLRGNLYATGV